MSESVSSADVLRLLCGVAETVIACPKCDVQIYVVKHRWGQVAAYEANAKHHRCKAEPQQQSLLNIRQEEYPG